MLRYLIFRGDDRNDFDENCGVIDFYIYLLDVCEAFRILWNEHSVCRVRHGKHLANIYDYCNHGVFRPPLGRPPHCPREPQGDFDFSRLKFHGPRTRMKVGFHFSAGRPFLRLFLEYDCRIAHSSVP